MHYFLFGGTEMELKIEYLPINALKPYEKNTRKHKKKDVDNIARSIKKFGMNDPIGIWKDNIIVEGHGRLLACKQLGMTEVPCVRLDHLTDEQRREYAIAHNATAEMSIWYKDVLAEEVASLDVINFDFSFLDEEKKENPYTSKIKIPQYEVQGEQPSLDELYDTDKTDDLIAEIQISGVSEAEKQFLIEAAKRHTVFNYRNIAEYYAHASYEMQQLMERSALVIIDYEDAIANGYVRLSERLKRLRDDNA